MGPDEIHYQMLKHLLENSLETLLNIFNLITFRLLANFQMIGNMQQLFLFPNMRNQIIIDL